MSNVILQPLARSTPPLLLGRQVGELRNFTQLIPTWTAPTAINRWPLMAVVAKGWFAGIGALPFAEFRILANPTIARIRQSLARLTSRAKGHAILSHGAEVTSSGS